MMDPEIKKKWVKALRSGDYKQSKNRLRDDTGFCCLGVLCDILFPDSWNGDLMFNSRMRLPYEVVKAAGLQGDRPMVYVDGEDVQKLIDLGYHPECAGGSGGSPRKFGVTNLNDSGEFSFDRIADFIEDQL